jgi:transcription factor-like protein
VSNPESEDVDAIRAFYGLFNILIALGSLHSTPSLEGRLASSKAVTGDTFFDRAEHLITERTMSHNTILSVQVYILMAHYLQITGNVNKCWVMVGTAIRTAQGLGIHLSPASESQAQQEERRRTWSFCLQMDR